MTKFSKQHVLKLGIFNVITIIEINMDRGITFNVTNETDSLNFEKGALICGGYFSENSTKINTLDNAFSLFKSHLITELNIFFDSLVIDEIITYKTHKEIQKLRAETSTQLINVNGNNVDINFVIKMNMSDYEIKSIGDNQYVTSSNNNW